MSELSNKLLFIEQYTNYRHWQSYVVQTKMFNQKSNSRFSFRKKLDTKNVSLENVIVKENESMVVGTIKVRNLNFSKEVIVRTSWDDWKSQEDTFCTFSQVIKSAFY